MLVCLFSLFPMFTEVSIIFYLCDRFLLSSIKHGLHSVAVSEDLTAHVGSDNQSVFESVSAIPKVDCPNVPAILFMEC